MKRGMLLLLCAAMITGLYTDKAYAEDMLTYDLRADRTVYYTAQSAGGPITLTVPMYIAHDPGTVGINAAFRVDAPLEITGLTFAEPYCYGDGRVGGNTGSQCRVVSPQSAKLLWYTSNNGENEIIYDSTRPFVLLTVVIPQDTPAGVYEIAFDLSGTSVCNQEREQLSFTYHNLSLSLWEGKPYFLRGDPGGNGTVDVSDAVEVLQYCAEASAGQAPDRDYAWLCGADATENGSVEVADAVAILQYCAKGLTDQHPEW